MLYICFFGFFLIFQTAACSKEVVSNQNKQENVVQTSTTINTAKIHDFAVSGDNLWIVEESGNLTLYEWNGQPTLQGKRLQGYFQNVSFIDDKVGWALENSGQVKLTSDGGLTWIEKGKIGKNPPSPFSGLLVFSNPSNGWFANMAEVWRTGDAGDTWTRVYPTDEFSYSTLKAQPLSLLADNPEAVWIGMSNGKILVTNDQGSTWKLASLPEEIDVESIYCASNESCWVGASGGGGLFFTSNSGQNWRQVLSAEIRESLSISSISFANAKTGWIVGHPFYSRMESLGTMPRCLMLKTSDGGLTWDRLNTASIDVSCTRLSFTNEDIGWLIGDDSVFRSSDGGKSWIKVVQF